MVMKMIECECIPRKWGNSLGIVFPKEVVEKASIKAKKKIRVLIREKEVDLSEIFGSLKTKMSGQEFKDMVREGWK